jgi:FAD/FMN-containing dehydrogenase
VTLERELVDIVGRDQVLTDPGLRAPYESDWTRRWSGSARAVVRPADTGQVAAVLRSCATYGAPVVTQGGNTGLVGGSVPRCTGQVVLSTARLQRLQSGDHAVVAGAGVTIGRLQVHARAIGLAYGVDLASRDTATVGGTVATDAGGIRVVRYGRTRAQVRGLEVVLADGSLLSDLERPGGADAGPDLLGLFVGSEGAFGVVTAARLRLVPRPPPGTTVLVGCPDVDAARALVPADGVRAAELMTGDGIDLVCRTTGLRRPLRRTWPVVLLLETDQVPDLPDDADAVVDARVWELRERHTEAIATLGVVHKLDVALPLHQLATFLADLPALVAPHRAVLFGHLAVGGLHVNVVGPAAGDETVDRAVLERVAALGGSIAAEHGFGIAKSGLMHLVRSREEIDLLRRVKHALDPAGQLNPGVLVP